VRLARRALLDLELVTTEPVTTTAGESRPATREPDRTEQDSHNSHPLELTHVSLLLDPATAGTTPRAVTTQPAKD